MGAFWHSLSNATYSGVSFWLLVPIVVAIGASPWVRWRFSLRALLFGMTVLAVGLGLIVWAAK
jgi:hypothetical protein